MLLTNDNVLFGHAQQVGQYVIVRRESGGEVQLPRQQVVCWAGDVTDLYRYRIDHRHSSGVQTHLTDAQWCASNDLYDLAEREIAAARAIDPDSRAAFAIERQIASGRAAKSSVALVANVETINEQLANERGPNNEDYLNEDYLNEDHADDAAAGSIVDPITLRFFASVVQPMLINRCGNCHSHESDRDWSILIPGATSRPSSRMTRENLTSSLAFVDRDRSEDSELLRKAISPHGGAPAMMDTRHARSIEALKAWLQAAANESSPSPYELGVDAEPLEIPSPPPEDNIEDAGVGLKSPLPWDAAPRNDIAPVQSLETNAGKQSSPSRMPPVVDPFSPDLFNRLQTHR